MAVVLILVGGLAIAGERSLQASRETSAAQTVQSFAANETVFQRSYGGFSSTAASLGIPAAGGNASCTADGEITQALATGYDTGLVQGGYTLSYKAAGAFTGSACGGGSATGAPVDTTYDFIANPVDLKTKSFCADSTGEYYLPSPTPMVVSGAGCLADNAGALAVGQ
jgi:hypothetical protein